MRPKGAAPLSAAVVILFLSMPCAAQDAGAKLFVNKCSPCHSIGGGDLAGPDLVKAVQLPTDGVRTAVQRMEANVGSMTVDEVEALVVLLKNPQAKELIAAAQNPQPVQEVERGSAKNGRPLFYGDARLRNGGSPCFACHTVAGRGGNLAKDLTLGSHSPRAQCGVLKR